MKRSLGFLGAAWVGLLTGCEAFVGDYVADLEPVTEVDISELCDIERSHFVLPLDLDSSDSLPDLKSYFAAANPALLEHFDSVVQAYRDGETQARVTYVMGAAGVGKSFALRNILDGFDETEQCAIDMVDLLGSDPESLPFEVERVTDLGTLDGELSFNELLSLVAPEQLSLDQLLEAGGCYVDGTLVPLILIDGIDEVHDTTSAAVLEAVDRAVLEHEVGADSFVHFLIAGRPEGFATWLTDPGWTEEDNAIVDRFDLAAPAFQTAGDLEFRVRDYLDFARAPGELSESEIDAHVDSFITAVAAHPFLTYSIGNLSVGNVAIEHTVPGLDVSESELKAGLFDDILVRDADTHGRPGADSEFDAAYRHILEDIAVQYADVGDDGVFSVRAEDSVEVFDDDGGTLGEVRVRDVLDRGGVAFLTSASSRTTRYRFDPFWLHAHLIERENLRKLPDYEYRGCE